MSLRSLLRAWEEFFFAKQSPVPIALFRIVYGRFLPAIGRILLDFRSGRSGAVRRPTHSSPSWQGICMHSSPKTLGSAYDLAATVVALLRNILTKNQGGSLVAGHGTLLCVSHRRTQTVSAARWFFDPIVLKVGSWSALALEFSLGVLIWVKEFRYVLLVLGVMFHLWLEYSLNVPLFQ